MNFWFDEYMDFINLYISVERQSFLNMDIFLRKDLPVDYSIESYIIMKKLRVYKSRNFNKAVQKTYIPSFLKGPVHYSLTLLFQAM